MENKRLYNLDAIKVFSALGIFLTHAGLECPPTVDLGARGVENFIIISGILTYYSYPKTSYSSWKGKCISVYPIHFITLLIALIFFPISVLKYGKSAIINLTLNALLLQDFSKEPTTGNWVSWYLCVYLLCAIFAPIIIKAINESGMKASILLIVSLGIRYILESWRSEGYWDINFHYSPFIRLLEFMASVCCGYILLKIESAVQKKISKMIWFLIEVAIVFIYFLSYKYEMLRFWHVIF